jgi:hypothetical protein
MSRRRVSPGSHGPAAAGTGPSAGSWDTGERVRCRLGTDACRVSLLICGVVRRWADARQAGPFEA